MLIDISNFEKFYIYKQNMFLMKSYKGAEWYYDTDITQPDKTKIIA